MDPMRRCEHCEGNLPATARSDARFCASRCRVAAHRRRNTLPSAMTSERRWVRRAANKMPMTVSGRAASSTDPKTWTTHAAATESTAGVGLGFVLGGGFGCVDLDHCIDGGQVAPWAAKILAKAPETFIERSPSGHGIHIWGRLPERPGRKMRTGPVAVEFYSVGRYITVTGDVVPESRPVLADLTEFIEWLEVEHDQVTAPSTGRT